MFGAYRTLKVQIFGFRDDTMDVLRAKLAKQFSDVPIIVENTEPGWTDVTVNQDEVPLLDVLNFVMGAFAVRDVRIVEISMENVVQKIYDGALG